MCDAISDTFLKTKNFSDIIYHKFNKSQIDFMYDGVTKCHRIDFS